jgi:prohibitin 2
MSIFKDEDGDWTTGGTVIAVFGGVFALIFGLAILFGSWYTIDSSERGIITTLGKVDTTFKTDGFHFKLPLVSSVSKIIIRQQTISLKAECYSSDLQDLNIDLKVLYRIPENQVVKIFRDFAGNPFDSLLAPRILEALKEVSASNSAESVVKNRELIKLRTLEISKKKVGDLLWIEDIVIENISLTKQLSDAIEQKMIAEQSANKSKFAQVQARTEAETAVISARGEAEAISIKGQAVAQNPKVIDLEIVKKWDGKSPSTVVVGSGGANILLPTK